MSATTAFDGSSRVVIIAVARCTPAWRSTVASRASPQRNTAPSLVTASSDCGEVSITTHGRPPRSAAVAAERPTRPKPITTTWSCRLARTFDLLSSRTVARISPDTNNAVSDAAEYTNTANPARMVPIVHSRPHVPSGRTSAKPAWPTVITVMYTESNHDQCSIST